MKPIYLLLIYLLIHSLSCANTDTRVWKLKNGEKLTAALVSYNEKTGNVMMSVNDETPIPYHFDDFSNFDRAWLIEWSEISDRLQEMRKELGGEIEHLQTTGKYPTDAYVYYPSPREQDPGPGPAMILFNASGKPMRYLKRHLEAAEQTNLVLIALGSFRNSHNNQVVEEFETRFEEVFPQLRKRVRFDHNRLFMGGNSGGALRAFNYSYKFDWPWAGIYSNGGWLGKTSKAFYENPPMYRAGMRVAIVNGNKDYANWVIEEDTKALLKRGCKVALFAFEGGHQAPPTSAQEKAFSWLLEQEDFIEQ